MIKTIVYQVTYRRSKSEPQITEIKNTAEAAYKFALDIEINGGITVVTPIERFVTENVRQKLSFEDDDNV